MINQRLGMVLSTVLFTSCVKTHNFTQACVGVELWRQGCSLNVFKMLNALGTRQCKEAARGHVDKVRRGHDAQILEWKAAVEV